jgi:hypothetical protein
MRIDQANTPATERANLDHLPHFVWQPLFHSA